jgi:hypothetical protein
MAEVTRVNPVATTTNYEVVGKDITFFTVDYINAVNGSAGPNGAQAAVLRTIQMNATIIAAGPLVDTNTQQTFAVEGDFNITAKWDGTNSETFAVYLTSLVVASGNLQGVNNASTTVGAGILTAGAI